MAQNWLKMTPNSIIPPNAVIGGLDSGGTTTYVGRTCHEGDILPARVDSKKHCAYISWAGSQIKKTNFEILVGDKYKFVKYYADTIPLSAVRAGNTADGEPLYVGRGIVEGKSIVGKIHPIHQCLFVAYGGEEHQLDSYEILVHDVTSANEKKLDKDTPTDSVLDKPVESHTWLSSNWDVFPQNAVIGGADVDSTFFYVGRVLHDGVKLPAKVKESKQCWVNFGGFEIPKPPQDFEILVGDGYSWVVGKHHCGNNIPPGAVSTGYNKDSNPVYVGRGFITHNGQLSLTPGKVILGRYGVLVPFFGKERMISDYYEILVKN